ncbi:Regulator of sigma-W protease RasP [Metalysinibacillus saudimassiliensis]|uniref:Zinc metalloprotease n=1 Tax=Metalysinibacillus saudimassiliensis TaxID=1461583 RepID=A0A078ME52_9BACL|nr:Regulator of sigma-W protease RasP [Metalysinibacillus saudimassiliensis]
MQTAIAFIIIFGSLVFFHELGHFLLAKRAGILVREFAIGFGPKIYGNQRGETLYTIRLLPLGGYVRYAGADLDTVELVPGYRVALALNKEDVVTKIMLNQSEKQLSDIVFMEVEKADLVHELWIEGYDEEEKFVRFNVSREAVVIENGQENVIAPFDRQFESKSLFDRFATIFAGPLFNFILAFFIFVVAAFIGGVSKNEPVLGDIIEDGSAQVAGLEKGDVVTAIDGTKVNAWDKMVGIIQESPDKEITMHVKRDGKELDIPVVVEKRVLEQGKERIEQGAIGVMYGGGFERGFVKSIQQGGEQVWYWSTLIFTMLGKLVTGQFSIDALSGPVGIYQVTDQVASYGILSLMNFAGMLSINLGIMNLLPIPALDGGRLLFIAIEAVRGKPVDRNKEGMVHFVGIMLLLLLMIAVTWNDIQRFFF